MSGTSSNYTPNSEEAALLDHFKDIEKGVFVEVGANHPFDLSVSWPFERRGWTGLLIEPLPECAAMLRAQRRAKVIELACAAPDSPASVEIVVNGMFSTVSGAAIGGATHGANSSRLVVACKTLDEVLEENGVHRINLLSIDVEGFEFDVLRGFSADRYRPDLIFIEDHMHTLKPHRMLQACGYKLVRRTGVNSWYARQAIGYRPGLAERLKLMRKLALSPMKHRIKGLFGRG